MNTDFLGLSLTERSTDEMTFLEWRSRIDGIDNSNMQILDKAISDLSSNVDTKTTDLQSQLNTKVDKVEGKGLSTNDYDDSAEEKVLKIGNVSKIPTDSRYIVQWIQDVYDSVFKSSADNTCLADEVAAEISHRQSADEDLQSQIDNLSGVDVSELQADIDTLNAKMLGDISRLSSKDKELQSQIDNKSNATNLVNGSAKGSLRGICAEKESSEYTMGVNAVALGEYTIAGGKNSYTEGNSTIATGECQHVQGKYNIEDTNGKYVHIVGNGTHSNYSNAHTLDWDGNAWFAGDVLVGGTSQDDENAISLADIAIKCQTDIETLTTNVSNLQSADATAIYKIGKLVTADENLQSQINALTSRIQALESGE